MKQNVMKKALGVSAGTTLIYVLVFFLAVRSTTPEMLLQPRFYALQLFPVFLIALLASVWMARALRLKTGTAVRQATRVAQAVPTASDKDRADSLAGDRELGSVKWFNSKKGFGFITRDDGGDVFVHYRSIQGQRSLAISQEVEFTVVESDRGLQARDVTVLQ